MNNFGLGLILNFTDNATSGMQNATRSFQDLRTATADFSQANGVDSALMSISASCGIIGSELVQVGESITSTFVNATKSIIETGTTISMAKKQLSTLYDSEVLGAEKLEQVKDYAAKSIFNFKDLIPSVIMLKANGIEAFDQIASSAYTASNGTEGARQTLMDYASDLAAFNPRMRNMYGTGVKAAMGSLNEYIAEGNAVSLKRGASLDINALLGEKTAGSIEERSVQVADLLEKLKMVGMTASMANTPMQRLSNVSDMFFNLVTDIAESGVMEKYTELVMKFTDYLFAIPDEEMKNMANVIGGAISELMIPLSHIIDLGIKVVDWLRETVKTNPELVKTIIKVTALVGVFALLSGIALKLASSLGFLRIALFGLTGASSAKGGLKLLGLFKNLALFVLPVIAAIILLKLAWDKNFMGIRDTTNSVLKDIWDSFKIVIEAFKGNSLSEESFLRAKDLGILPLIESILQLKYHWGFFVSGFKKGIDAFFNTLGEVLVRTGILDTDVSGLGGAVKALIDKMTAPGMTETWENVGKFLGESAGWVILIIALLPVALKLVSLIVGVTKILLGTIKAIWTVFTIIIDVLKMLWSVGRLITILISGLDFAVIGTAFASMGTAIAGFFSAVGTAILGVLGAIAAFVGLPVWLVALIIVAIVAIVALVIIFWDEIKAFFINIGTAIADFFVGVFNKIKQNPIVQTITGVFSVIVSVIKSFISNAVQIVVGFAHMIWTIAKGIFGIIKSIVKGIVNIIKAVVGVICNIVYAIYEVIRVIVLAIIFVIQKIWEVIKTGLDFVFGIFSSVFGAVYDAVIAPIVEKISVVWGWLCDNVFAPVGEFISGIFDNIVGKVQVVGEFFKTIFGGVRDFMCSAFQKVSDFVSPLLKGISDAITWIADAITKVISGVGDFFGGVGEFFGGIGDGLQEAVGLSTGGYVKTTGIAMLHPDEVVVNDALTQRLGAFLGDYNNAKFTNSPLVTQNIVATDDYKEDKSTPVNTVNPTPQTSGNDTATDINPSPLRELANTQVSNNTTNHMKSEEDNSSADNRVVFESGSIVVQAVGQNGKISDEELYAMSDKLMQIMGRKMQLRNLQTRK